MEDIDPGKGIKSQGNCCGKKKSKEGSQVENPRLAAGPCPTLDIHDRPGDHEAEKETSKGN